MKKPNPNPLTEQALQAYRNDVVNYVARLTAGRMKQRMAEANVPVDISLESVVERMADVFYDLILLSLAKDSPLPAEMWVGTVFDGIKAYTSSDEYIKVSSYEPNFTAKGSELMLLFSRCAEKVGRQISDLLSDLLSERALTKSAPMGYIAHVVALAAKKVNQQTND